MQLNLLFTSVGRRVELLRCFRDAYSQMDIEGRIIAVDVDPLAPALHEADKAYIVPRLDSPDYVSALLEILKLENVSVVFPLIDPDIAVLANNQAELEASGAQLAVVAANASLIADDKWRTTSFFKGLGIPTPRSWLPGEIDDSTTEYPLFIKPRSGSASHHVFKVNNAEELAFFSRYISDPIIQEYLLGPEITNDVICDLKGKVLSVVSRQRIRVRGGEVVVGKTVVCPVIEDACVRIAEALPARGPITVQCMMNGATAYFTEINARLGGGAPLGIAAGDGWLCHLLSRLAGIHAKSSSFCSYKDGVYFSRFDESVLVTDNQVSQLTDQADEWDAVIFDLDDTLYLERDYVLSGFNAVANWVQETMGFPANRTFDEFEHLFNAGIRGDTFDRWLSDKGLATAEWLEPLIRKYRSHNPTITLSASMGKLLDALRANCRVGLITDGNLEVQKRKVDALKLHERFDCIVYSDALGRDAWKPSPRPFQEALARLSVAPNKAIYIGDNPAKDFHGARRLGMGTMRARLPGGLHYDAEPQSEEYKADVQISNLDELQAALRNTAFRRIDFNAKPMPIGRPIKNIRKQPEESQNRIYLSPPHMSPRERELLLDAFDSNWIAPLGPHVDALESEFAEKVGINEAVALSSGTAALHLSLLLLGVEQGDEVFTSSLTFAATANAITYVGAQPVFIDSDSSTWNMDPDLLGQELESSAKRGKLPKAIISVDLYGQCADYDRILKICRFYDVPLVEDAAEALGATYRGKSAGTFGSFGVFSFNGNKIITTSGGGMLVTDDKDLAEKARFLATQARDPAPHYQHSEIGYNYRLSNLLAAIGRGQLSVLETRVDQRRANFEYYRGALADLPGIRFMPEISGGRSTRWLTCLVIDPAEFGATTEDVRLAHERHNIESRPLWKPMHLQPVFANCRSRGGAVAEQLFRHGLCLPSGSSLTESDRERVVEIVRSVAKPRSTTVPLESAAGNRLNVG